MDMGIHTKRISAHQGGAKTRTRLRPADPLSEVRAGPLRWEEKRFFNSDHDRALTNLPDTEKEAGLH